MKASRILWLLSIPLFALHGVEEYATGFPHTDPLTLFASELLGVGPYAVFFGVEVMLGIFLLLPFFLSFRPVWYRAVLGVILLLEVDHVVRAIQAQSYYSGLWTAVPLVVIGLLYWKHMVRKGFK